MGKNPNAFIAQYFMYENNPDSWTSALVAVSGSVAAVKAPEIVARLLNAGVSVDLVLTESAYKLMQATYNNEKPWEILKALQVDRCVTPTMKPTLRIYRDANEWSAYNTVGEDPVLHIELAKRNKLLLIAPLCANTAADGHSWMQSSFQKRGVRIARHRLHVEAACTMLRHLLPQRSRQR